MSLEDTEMNTYVVTFTHGRDKFTTTVEADTPTLAVAFATYLRYNILKTMFPVGFTQVSVK